MRHYSGHGPVVKVELANKDTRLGSNPEWNHAILLIALDHSCKYRRVLNLRLRELRSCNFASSAS